MYHLSELLDLDELDLLMQEGRIARQVHPKLPIHILNYTAKAQFMNKWTTSERVCRGLILEDHSLNVIARGPAKFFNYGDPRVPQVSLDSLTRATVKHDGSLGIGWRYDGHYGIATRGSFMSPQAVHATGMMNDDIGRKIFESSERNFTRVFEIVYPENRIVLDYGDRDELIELGQVWHSDGVIHFRPKEMFRTEVISLADAFRLPVSDDEEGFVLDVQPGNGHDDFHVKIKGETYKLLHAILTETSARRIWTQLAWRACESLLPAAEEGSDAAEKVWAFRLGNDPADFKRIDTSKSIEETFLEQVPDEFYDWVTKQIDSIEDNVYSLIGQGMVLADKIKDMPQGKERHDIVKDHPLVTEIIRYVDRGDASGMTVLAWKLSKPGDETPFKTKEED
ncbi:RNA ligase [Arthrobacter phage Atuin]|nr:RNA ligase [Arthrobacter phage Atuin]